LSATPGAGFSFSTNRPGRPKAGFRRLDKEKRAGRGGTTQICFGPPARLFQDGLVFARQGGAGFPEETPMKKILAPLVLCAFAVMVWGASSSAETADIAATANFEGVWRTEGGEIVIKNQSAQLFEFSFHGYSESGNTGELEGVAVVTSFNTAVYKNKNEYDGRIAEVTFNAVNGTLVVDEANSFGLFGMGVYISGMYKK
jgi:hypothetical protein